MKTKANQRSSSSSSSSRRKKTLPRKPKPDKVYDCYEVLNWIDKKLGREKGYSREVLHDSFWDRGHREWLPTNGETMFFSVESLDEEEFPHFHRTKSALQVIQTLLDEFGEGPDERVKLHWWW